MWVLKTGEENFFERASSLRTIEPFMDRSIDNVKCFICLKETNNKERRDLKIDGISSFCTKCYVTNASSLAITEIRNVLDALMKKSNERVTGINSTKNTFAQV